jgi:hypothetical protein
VRAQAFEHRAHKFIDFGFLENFLGGHD